MQGILIFASFWTGVAVGILSQRRNTPSIQRKANELRLLIGGLFKPNDSVDFVDPPIGIPMSKIRVGMKLKNILSPSQPEITVTELTQNGFKYEHEPRTYKIGWNGGIPEFGIVRGGEHYGYQGFSSYEEAL